ncbi:MAG: methionine transporter, partial [Acinetobacter sp.]|nr:methionine transporter [Acinetobacter sp.]
MAQTAKTKFTVIGVIVAAIVIALVAWSYHKKSSNSELVIG